MQWIGQIFGQILWIFYSKNNNWIICYWVLIISEKHWNIPLLWNRLKDILKITKFLEKLKNLLNHYSTMAHDLEQGSWILKHSASEVNQKRDSKWRRLLDKSYDFSSSRTNPVLFVISWYFWQKYTNIFSFYNKVLRNILKFWWNFKNLRLFGLNKVICLMI